MALPSTVNAISGVLRTNDHREEDIFVLTQTKFCYLKSFLNFIFTQLFHLSNKMFVRESCCQYHTYIDNYKFLFAFSVFFLCRIRILIDDKETLCLNIINSLTFRHRASSTQGRRFATLQRTLFIYLINKYISLSDICLTVHH